MIVESFLLELTNGCVTHPIKFIPMSKAKQVDPSPPISKPALDSSFKDNPS